MQHRELRVLWDWTIPPANLPQLANTWQRPTARDGGGELEKDEVAEVVRLEVFSPRTGLGVAEDLYQVLPVIDDTEIGDYVSLSGRYDSLMNCPLPNAWQNTIYTFGKPTRNEPLLSTTLKYTTRLTFSFLCGPGGPITQAYRLRAWGYVYKEGELPQAFGLMGFPTQIQDRVRSRVLLLNKSPIPVTKDSWATLPGGKNQAPPKVMPFIRFAYNLLATDGVQGEYALDHREGRVRFAAENMYFEFDELDAVLVEGLGMRAPANLAWTYMNIGGDVHPKGRTVDRPGFQTQQFNNPLHYGHLFPLFDLDFPSFRAVPRLDQPYLVWNEKGYVAIRDAGAVVAAGGAVAALTGIRIEQRG